MTNTAKSPLMTDEIVLFKSKPLVKSTFNPPNAIIPQRYVIFSKDITPYQRAKITGLSGATISRVINGKQNLSWKSIAKIEIETGIPFKGQDHMIGAAEQSFIPKEEQFSYKK